MIFYWKSICIYKISIFHSQFFSLVIHHFNKTFFTSTYIFSHCNASIIR